MTAAVTSGSPRLRVAVTTLGCRVNAADSMALQEAFRQRDVEVVDKSSPADLLVLNSCTVTHIADADARRLARRFKRDNPGAQVVVTGCYAQVSPEDLRQVPEIDWVVGNEGKSTLVDRVMDRRLRGEFDTALREKPENPGRKPSKRTDGRVWNSAVRPARSHVTALPESHTRPFLKVQDGCDYSCAFCIIPKARGVSRSVAVRDVLHQALSYADLGASEIVLTGIHLGHWGRDMSPRRSFASVVAELLDGIAADGRIAAVRLGSVEPNEVTEPLLDLLADHPLLCEHLHVPLQSGDDDTLKSMRRLYTAQQYEDTIVRLRDRLPKAALGADVLVGHPGESAASFANTRALVERLDLSYLHVFPWSPRRGTPAATMPRRVSDEDKRDRVKQLVRLSGAKRHFFHRRFVGDTVTAVVLGGNGDPVRALSRNYIPLNVEVPADLPVPARGALIVAEITQAGADRCSGRLTAAI